MRLRKAGVRVDLCQVAVVAPGCDAARRRARREPRIVRAIDVVGHAEHVEALAPVEVDELGKRQRTVAPARVGVELAEQRLDLPAHPQSVWPTATPPRADRW